MGPRRAGASSAVLALALSCGGSPAVSPSLVASPDAIDLGTFSWDDADALTRVEPVANAVNCYMRDTDGRLDRVHLRNSLNCGNTSGAWLDIDYSYDLAGHLDGWIQTDSDGGYWDPEATGVETAYIRDALGQIVAVEETDPAIGPSPETIATFEYDALGDLVRSEVEGVVRTYSYFGGNLDAIFDDAGDLVLRFIYGPKLDWVVAAQDDAGNYYGYQLDASNSVRRIKDAGGAVVTEYEYDFWGNPLSETESIEQPLRFQGRLWFPELGLYNFRARWYDPSLGRFLSEDSYWPAQPHPYAFVGSDPLNYVDPTGDVLGALAGMGTVTDALGGLQHWADLNRCMGAAEAYQQWSRDMLRLAGTTVVFAVVGGVAFRTTGGAVRGGGGTSKGAGRARNKLRPHPDSSGPHSTFKRGTDGKERVTRPTVRRRTLRTRTHGNP